MMIAPCSTPNRKRLRMDTPLPVATKEKTCRKGFFNELGKSIRFSLSPKLAEQTQPTVEGHFYEEEESAYEDEVADAKQQKEHPSFEEARTKFAIKGKTLVHPGNFVT